MYSVRRIKSSWTVMLTRESPAPNLRERHSNQGIVEYFLFENLLFEVLSPRKLDFVLSSQVFDLFNSATELDPIPQKWPEGERKSLETYNSERKKTRLLIPRGWGKKFRSYPCQLSSMLWH